jgi:hypothetical protein
MGLSFDANPNLLPGAGVFFALGGSELRERDD